MMGCRTKSHTTMPVAEVAAGWVLEEEAGLSLARDNALEVWLAEDVAHADAYQQARYAQEAVGRFGAEHEMMALREAALCARPEQFGRPIGKIAAGLAALMLISGAGWWALDRGLIVANTQPTQVTSELGSARYQTARGERSTVTLADGSVMTLNTASLADVSYDGSERAVSLHRGQALFDVAHDPETPFKVYAGDRVITAIGTSFEVYLDGDQVRVALLEGRVNVVQRNSEGTSRPLAENTLNAGEVLFASPAMPTRVRGGDVERLLSWKDGLVAFDQTPLSEAVKEMNRYASRPLILADGVVGRHRVSGTFRVGETERFARTVSELFPITSTSSGDGRTVLSDTAE